MTNLATERRLNFLSDTNVSRETMEKLDHLVARINQWSPRINLISPNSLDIVWQRHILDSAQLFSAPIQNRGTWLDLGSGGGFPGLIIAIMAAERTDSFRVVLVESDQRKCVFLEMLIRELELDCAVKQTRIEALEPQAALVISARALAPLPKLLVLAAPHLAPDGICLFPKGKNYRTELTETLKCWKLSYDILESRTAPQAGILRIHEAIRV